MKKFLFLSLAALFVYSGVHACGSPSPQKGDRAKGSENPGSMDKKGDEPNKGGREGSDGEEPSADKKAGGEPDNSEQSEGPNSSEVGGDGGLRGELDEQFGGDGPLGEGGGGGREEGSTAERTPERQPAKFSPQPWEQCEGKGKTVIADPRDYLSKLSSLKPGDTLKLKPGDYRRGMKIRVSGLPGKCITIEALDKKRMPRILSGGSNVIDLYGVKWLKLRYLKVDSQGKRGIFGVALKKEGGPSHHVVLEGILLVGQYNHQLTVGISTKAPAWNWIIRGNYLDKPGTGMYLGNSDGRQPFIGGIIEYNTVIDPIGYGIQIKHQLAGTRNGVKGIPTRADTIIRYNTVVKRRPKPGFRAEPSMLLGHFPPNGPGKDDRYIVYGNFFYDNPTERLLQSDSNLFLYNNVFFNPHGDAISLQKHNSRPRLVHLFFNTVVAKGMGIGVTAGQKGYKQIVSYNAIFAARPLKLHSQVVKKDNITANYSDADNQLAAPRKQPGQGLDLHPRPGKLKKNISWNSLPKLPDYKLDFDRRVRTGQYAGAYTGPADQNAVPLTLKARSYR